MISFVYIYPESNKSKYFKLKGTVYIHQFHPNNPPSEEQLELLYIKPLKHYFPEFETIKFRYNVFNTSILIYIENDEDYELLKSKYEWK